MKYNLKLSSRTLTLLKYGFAFTLLGILLNKVGLDDILRHMKQISVGEGILALLLATCAQYFSAMRMRYFFVHSGVPMGKYFASVLYYVGAFYNFLLPGGIGGDAYKIILVRRRLDMPMMQGLRLMVADRASGLCIVLLSLFLGLYLCGFGHAIPYGTWLLILATVATPVAYVIGSKILLKQLPLDMIGSLRYSIMAQLFWMSTLAVLWKAIGYSDNLIAYITLYCAASIASLIPLSVGGLGLRELTYFTGAGLMQTMVGLNVDKDIGIAISLCMFALTFISSLPGLFWMNKVNNIPITPKKKTNLPARTYGGIGNPGREDWT